MLNDKKFFVIESDEYVFAPYIEGERVTVIVRGTHVILKSNNESNYSSANVPDMKLNVIYYQHEYYIVNVTEYKNESVLNRSIQSRLALLTDLDLKNLDMKKMEFITFKGLYTGFGGNYVFRHKINDRDQGILTYSEIEQYREYILVVVTLAEAQKQKIELPLLEAESVLIEINMNEECKLKIFPDKEIDQCTCRVALGKNPNPIGLPHDLSFKAKWKEIKKKKLKKKTTRSIYKTM